MATYIIRFTVTWDKIDEALGNSLSEKVIFETGFAKNIVPDGRNYDKQIGKDKWVTLTVKDKASAVDYFYNRVEQQISYSSIPYAPQHIKDHILLKPYTGKHYWSFRVDNIGKTDYPWEYVMEYSNRLEKQMFDEKIENTSHRDKK